MRPVELTDTLVEVLICDWRRGEPELRRRLVLWFLRLGQRKTYAGVEDLRVLAISESLSPGGVMLADPESWTDMGESLRLRVQRPAGRHPECTFRVGRSRLRDVGKCVGGQRNSSWKITGMEELSTAEVRGWGRTVRETQAKSPDGRVRNTAWVKVGSRDMFLHSNT